MLRKINPTRSPVRNCGRRSTDEQSANGAPGLDEFIHAVAFVILRRQMRGRWTSTPLIN
jgi:hypothetical protein